MLTARDVLDRRFATTRFRTGYDQDQVDHLLDRVAVTLRESGTRPRSRSDVTAAELDALVLRTRTWLDGYEVAEVDDLLAEVRAALVHLAGQPVAPSTENPGGAREATGTAPEAWPYPPPDPDPGSRFLRLLRCLLIGAPSHRPPLPTTPVRAPRAGAWRTTVGPEGIDWVSRSHRPGRLAVAEIARVVEVTLALPRGGTECFALLVDHDGVVLLRARHAPRSSRTGRWAALGVPVVDAPGDVLRAKDARRTWPEAFSLLRAYPIALGVGAFLLYTFGVVPVLVALGL
jgi:DivIVA domain-containing protein